MCISKTYFNHTLVVNTLFLTIISDVREQNLLFYHREKYLGVYFLLASTKEKKHFFNVLAYLVRKKYLNNVLENCVDTYTNTVNIHKLFSSCHISGCQSITSPLCVDFDLIFKMRHRSLLNRQTCCEHSCRHKELFLFSLTQRHISRKSNTVFCAIIFPGK